MKIVVDSNRVIASLIKEGTSREILFNKNFEFIAPSYIFSEIHKYKDYLIKKSNITEKDFEILLSLVFENIRIIPNIEYDKFIQKFEKQIDDKKDAPYLALCFATNSKGVWTHDPHFKKQNKIKIFTNIDLLKTMKEDD